MLVIGITGGTGSGKTTALDAVRKLGGAVIDCDEVYHRLLKSSAEMLDGISRRFPGTVKDGALDRKKLGQIVFGDEQALEELNGMTHRYVAIEVKRLLDQARDEGRSLAAIDAIALIESGISGFCDVTAAVTAPAEDRVKRLMRRENISEEYARRRIAAQKSDGWYAENCDIVLDNGGRQDEFESRCIEIFAQLLKGERGNGDL